MTRLRITLLLLALGIAVPGGLIVQRALESIHLENAFQHETVARRVFDEMERALSDFLVREEIRPIGDYETGDPERFGNADEPFLIGWFSLDAAGVPRVIHARGDASRVSAAVSAAWGAPDVVSAAGEGVPAPGGTRRLGEKGEAESEGKDALRQKQSGTAYDVLSSLNRAQELRSERKSKVRQAMPQRAGSSSDYSRYDMPMALEQAAPAEADFRQLPSGQAASATPGSRARGIAIGIGDEIEADSAAAEPLRELQALGYVMAEAEEFSQLAKSADAAKKELAAPPLAAALAPALQDRAAEPVVDPLIGRTTSDGQLVLVRSIWRNGGAERQGVVLDRTALADWLEQRVLSATGLRDRARVDFSAPTLPERTAAEHSYVHHFAEPFDALVAQLDLDPLPGLGAAQPIYALSALLAAVAIVGLFAVQRGAKVVVDYAQRRSDFVASVSHELKTPLTAIRMYGEMLRDGLVGSERKRDEYYATIADESERLSRLIDNVLEFSRLEQNSRPLELVVGALDAALREAAEKLRAHVEREGFQLRLEIDHALPAVRYDRDAVTQVVFNLVDNALKYARSTDRRDIVIALRRSDQGVELCVRDYGPGVPAGTLRRVFEPFYRGGDELTRTAKGTGIGLALVRELAEAMGASVRGDNASGGGFEVAVAFQPLG